MAQAQMCDTHADIDAMFIIHNLENVEFMGLCPACMTGFSIAWLQAVAPEMLAKNEPKPRRPRKSAAAALADDAEGGASDAGISTQEPSGAAAG